MDDFRIQQKLVSHDYSKHDHPHGCPCCRKFASITKHKRYAKKIARVRLKRQTAKDIKDT